MPIALKDERSVATLLPHTYGCRHGKPFLSIALTIIIKWFMPERGYLSTVPPAIYTFN